MAVDTSTRLAELPPPQTLEEIHFRRLLNACHRMRSVVKVAEQQDGQQQQDDAAAKPKPFDVQSAKLRHYVETLQEQLGELERSHAIELGFKTLAAYKEHVDALSSSVPRVTLPLYCQKPKLPAPVVLAGKQPFMPGLPRSSIGGTGKEDGAASASGLSAAISAAARGKLEHQERVQEALTDELVKMAGALKQGTLDVQDVVNKRGQLIDGTEQHLDSSLTNAKEVAAKSKKQYKRGGSTFCLTLLVLLVVGLVFTGMIVYIKFTHLLGYRSRPGSSTLSQQQDREL